MARSEEFPVKFILSITEEMEKAITDWRRKQPDTPPRAEAIRRLIRAGLGLAGIRAQSK